MEEIYFAGVMIVGSLAWIVAGCINAARSGR